MSAANTPHLVLLHHHKDSRAAEELVEALGLALRHDKLTLWAPQDLKPGEDKQARIQAELHRSTHVVLLLSMRFLADNTLHQTCRILLERGKVMIPMVVGAIVDTTGEPYHGKKYIEVAQVIAEEGEDVAWAKAVTALLQALESGQTQTGAGVASSPRASHIDASSPEAANYALDRMGLLLPSQFELLLFRLGVNASVLPGGNTSQVQRAMALITWIQGKGRMGDLLATLDQV